MSKFDEGTFGPNLEQPTKITDARQEEKLIQPTAIYTNKYYLTYQKDGMVRLVFADAIENGAEVLRYSVIMPIAAFLSLAQLIQRSAQGIISGMATPASSPVPPVEKEKLQ